MLDYKNILIFSYVYTILWCPALRSVPHKAERCVQPAPRSTEGTALYKMDTGQFSTIASSRQKPTEKTQAPKMG